MSKDKKKPFTLAIDVGGTFIKMLVMDAHGEEITPYIKAPTPKPATVKAMCAVMEGLIKKISIQFDRVSAGFPGVVVDGLIKTAPNLDPSWIGVNLETILQQMTNEPARVANDADVQGYGDAQGRGVELVITLGTGVGSALFTCGKLVPNLELGHHPFTDDKTYEQLLAEAALAKYGKDAWKTQLNKAITLWQRVFNCNVLYLGGGLAALIDFELPAGVEITKNIEGTLGGIKLWEK